MSKVFYFKGHHSIHHSHSTIFRRWFIYKSLQV
ncbi:hypothetical protein Goshw_022235 [Gossypium schwendimanii]|uniref:Uncharacterized protein n=1 Tax=Gossypium schwendimanii TaxID=34291 RepID=A0A7J9KYH6_GOSSC|nr:hypothetical protein [Gossypium schwendimanii]